MKEVAEIVMEISSCSGSLSKKAVLTRHRNNEKFRSVMRFIYNPYHKTGISAAKLTRALMQWPSEICAMEIDEVIKYFTDHNTGSDADLQVAAGYIHYVEKEFGEDAEWLARCLITQELTIGVTSTTLNSVYGKDFIPKIGCMLGTLSDEVKNISWPCIVTEKLDGQRRMLIKENGVCKLYTRSGHEDSGLVDIEREAQFLPDNYVYDGELIAIGDFKDNLETRQATNSAASCNGIRTGIRFNVFDMIPVDDFYMGRSSETANSRKQRLAATFKSISLQHLRPKDWQSIIIAFGIEQQLEYIVPVPILGVVNSMAEVEPYLDMMREKNAEGVMLNTMLGPYEIKRSKELIKVKFLQEMVLPVVGATEGEGRNEGKLGALLVGYKGSKVGVGTGFTDYDRERIWLCLDKYIGKNVEVETFGETTNATGTVSLNCCRFKRFVGEE